MAAHKHADVIKAWADGAQIQVKDGSQWFDIDAGNQIFHVDFEYRIKPAEPDKVYPSVSEEDANEWPIYTFERGLTPAMSTAGLINRTLKVACDKGVVVTREEFDRALGDRRERDKSIAGHVAAECIIACRRGGRIPALDEELYSIIDQVK